MRKKKNKPHFVEMVSDAYGAEQFAYDSFEEAVEGLIRLVNTAHTMHDGVVRSYIIAEE